MIDRRHFLAGALPAAAFVSAPSLAAASRAAPLTATQLADRLWLIAGAGGNVTVFQSSEGVLLVDAGAAAHSTRLLQEVKRLTGTDRVHTLFNTHWHADQTGSNATLGKAGTRIIAHENTRLWLTTDVEVKWESRIYQPLPKIAQPTQTFYTTGTLQFGGETIEYGLMPQAHTDGDIFVHFRKANVIVAADVVSVGAFPVIDYCTNGWIGGLMTAMETLMERSNATTQVVPGLGAPQSPAHVKAELAMLTTMRQRLSRLLAQGMSVQEMIAAQPAADLVAQWGDPKLFIANTWQGLVHRTGELGVSIV